MRTEAGAVVVVCHYCARVFHFTERCGEGDGVCVMGESKTNQKAEKIIQHFVGAVHYVERKHPGIHSRSVY